MTKHLIATLHGIGERDPNYAKALVDNLNSIQASRLDVEIVQLFYGDLLQPAEDIVNSALLENPWWKKEHMREILGLPLRYDVNQFMTDLAQWARNENLRKQIATRILGQLNSINYTCLHLVTHSFGSVVALSDDTYLPTLLLPEMGSITTSGNPMHLYSFANEFNTLDTPRKKLIPWANFFHTDDLIGAPLSTLFLCQDIEVKDSGPPTEIVEGLEIPFFYSAHNCYWKSKSMAEQIWKFVDAIQ